jgi:PAS domain-containing protein
MAAVHAGAQDYLVKGAVDGHLLRRTIRYAIERKAAALKMLAMAERHARILDGLGEGVLEVAANGQIIDCNPAALALLDGDREGLLGLLFESLGGGTDRAGSATAGVTEALASGRPVTVYAAGLSTVTGRQFEADLTVTAGTGENGGRVAIVALRDLADRNAAYASMRHSLSLQEQMVEAVPLPMFAVDAVLQITHCNSAFAGLLGSKIEQLLGFAVNEVLPDDLVALLPPLGLGLALSAEPSRLALRIGAAASEVTVLRRPLFDSDGHVAGFACVLTA